MTSMEPHKAEFYALKAKLKELGIERVYFSPNEKLSPKEKIEACNSVTRDLITGKFDFQNAEVVAELGEIATLQKSKRLRVGWMV